jgi:hypothetical protein
MKGLRVLTVLLLLVAGPASLGANGADFYGWWTGVLENFVDPNTGLTVFPSLLIPMGGGYEGMGTAYTALARDSGFIESNPSASSVLKNTELAFSHHNWIADSTLEGVVYTIRFNDLGIGVGGKFLSVPFTAYNEWGVSGAKSYLTESLATLNASYNFFSSSKFYGLAAGMNLKVAYRGVPAELAPNQSSFAFMTDIGLLTSFNFLKPYYARTKNFSVGMALKNLGIVTLAGEQLPLTATAGIAYSPWRPLQLSCDFNLPLSLDPVNAPAEKWNVAVGSSVEVARFMSMQAGVLLKPGNPRISLGAAIDMGMINLVPLAIVATYNLDLSGKAGPIDKFSVQARVNLGDRGRGALQQKVEELFLLGVEEYSNGNYARAVEFWKQVLEIEPSDQAAVENIRTAEDALSLQGSGAGGGAE